MYEANLCIAVIYISLCKFEYYYIITITCHIFISIFQREHSSPVKFAIGDEKNMAFLWYQNLHKFENKF